MTLLAQITTSSVSQEARGAGRRTLRLRVVASTSGDETDALIHNLSEHGLLVETQAPLSEGDTLEIDLPEAGVTEAAVVWTRTGLAGCEFRQPVATAVVSAALLRSPPADLAPVVLRQAPAASVWDYEPSDHFDPETSTRVATIASLALALIAATIFAVALLSFPFSIG